MNRTYGGLPEEEALHWNEDTMRQLGKVVLLVMSGNGDKAREGYIGFYQLKRKFFAEEFDSYVEKLDRFRAAKKFTTVMDMIEIVRKQMVDLGFVGHVEEQPHDIECECVTRRLQGTETVEQMVLVFN